MSGIRTSLTMQPVSNRLSIFRNWTAESYTFTAKPAVPSRNDRARRTSSSSSIRCTTVSGIQIFSRQAFQCQSEDGAAARIGFGPQLAAMGFNDRARNGQAHPHSLTLGGRKGLEQFLGDLRRNAATGV